MESVHKLIIPLQAYISIRLNDIGQIGDVLGYVPVYVEPNLAVRYSPAELHLGGTTVVLLRILQLM
jgi:hypothetical protein